MIHKLISSITFIYFYLGANLSSRKMGSKLLFVFAFLIVLTFAINEDMIKTGYLQDPASVGQLPSQFVEDIIETEDRLENEQLVTDGENNIESKRALEDDILSMDSSMQLDVEGFCSSEQGKDDILCSTYRL